MTRSINTLRVGPALAGFMFAGVWAQSTFAQAAPANATRPAAAPSTGNWWDAPAPPAPNAAPPTARRDVPGPYASSILDYPGSQMSDWVVANAMAARARAMRDRAQSELNLTIRRVQVRFEHSDDFVKATIAERQSYLAYVSARQEVIKTLFNDPKYHAIMQLHDELADKITARRGEHDDSVNIELWLATRGYEPTKMTGEQMVTVKAMFDDEQKKAQSTDVSPSEIMALATLKLQYATDARAIEIAALNADDHLKAAREKMIASSKQVSAMRAEFNLNFRDNPEIQIARRNLEDAKIAVIETAALASGANAASSYALNYAYYLHRNDNNGAYNQNGNGGYSSPYWGR